MLVPESIYEAIKNLPGRTPTELKTYFEGLSTFEKFEEGCKHGILWAIKEAIKNYPHMYKLAPETYCHGFANAAANNHIDIVKYLAKKPILDGFYKTYAIGVAAAFGHLDLLKYLIEDLKYDPAQTVTKRVVFTADSNREYSPLYTAAIDGFVEVVKYLISFKSVREKINPFEADKISQKTGIPLKDIKE